MQGEGGRCRQRQAAAGSGRQRKAEAGRGRQGQAEAGRGRQRQAEAGRGKQRQAETCRDRHKINMVTLAVLSLHQVCPLRTHPTSSLSGLRRHSLLPHPDRRGITEERRDEGSQRRGREATQVRQRGSRVKAGKQ
jgi:hypothetical protein